MSGEEARGRDPGGPGGGEDVRGGGLLRDGEAAQRTPRRAIDLAGRLALRPKEAAEALGLSERTLRRLLPELPHVRRDGVLLFPVEGLRRWLEEQARTKGDAIAEAVRAAVEAVSD